MFAEHRIQTVEKQSGGKVVDHKELASALRSTVGRFVRSVRSGSDTPPSAQIDTLTFIEQSGSISVAQLAQARAVRHQSMRSIVLKLRDAALVESRHSQVDRRSHQISISVSGRKFLAASREAREDYLAKLISEKLTVNECVVLNAALAVINKLTDDNT